MKQIRLFYLENCPYCRNARRAMEELTAERPEYGTLPVEWIEENRNPQLSAQYDYDYVPAVFVDGRKLYEAYPSESYNSCKAGLRAALDAALGR